MSFVPFRVRPMDILPPPVARRGHLLESGGLAGSGMEGREEGQEHQDAYSYMIRVTRDHVTQMIREAEQERLVREASRGASHYSGTKMRIATWFGALMERLGCALRPAGPSSQECCGGKAAG